MQKWFDYWKARRFEWYKGIINHTDRLRFRAHGPDELAHYAKQAFDIEYRTILDWQGWEGIHWKQHWVRSRHRPFTLHDLRSNDPGTKEPHIPLLVETSACI